MAIYCKTEMAKMPKCCADCSLIVMCGYAHWRANKIGGKVYPSNAQRGESCPLVSLPDRNEAREILIKATGILPQFADELLDKLYGVK